MGSEIPLVIFKISHTSARSRAFKSGSGISVSGQLTLSYSTDVTPHLQKQTLQEVNPQLHADARRRHSCARIKQSVDLAACAFLRHSDPLYATERSRPLLLDLDESNFRGGIMMQCCLANRGFVGISREKKPPYF